MSSSQTPSGASPAWITLDEAANALRVSQQTLWHRLQEQRVEVVRVERDGRSLSALSRDDLQRLATLDETPRSTPALAPAPQAAPRLVEKTAHPAQIDPESGPRSLWGQLRELEAQRDQLDFELRITRTQLNDMRSRTQHAEESARQLRGDLDVARAEVDELRTCIEPLRAEHSRDATTLQLERERRASVERQLARLIEIEEARERYCDRLERQLDVQVRLRRGA